MSENSTPDQHPFERFREAMKELVKVPKAAVLKREREEKEARKKKRDGKAD